MTYIDFTMAVFQWAMRGGLIFILGYMTAELLFRYFYH